MKKRTDLPYTPAAFEEAEIVAIAQEADEAALVRPYWMSAEEWRHHEAARRENEFEMLSPFRQLDAEVEREIAEDLAREKPQEV